MSVLKENTYFAGRYKLVRRLGSGGFSVVWLAQDTMAGDTEVALKIYAPDKGLDKDGIDNFRKEYAITLNLNHSSLLSTKHFDVNDGSPYLIMQFMPNGSALKLVENIDEKRLGKFIYAVASGLEYLHSHEPAIIHQDIKPDNVLISGKGDFLLTDFGISTRVRRTLTKSAGNVGYSGTIAYVPPERYMRNPKPQPEGDIFAFGIMLFELMTGYLPWNEQGGLGFIGSQIVPPIDADGFSDIVKDLTIACISFKPEDRPLALEIMLFAQSFVQHGFWDSKLMPESVKTVGLASQEETQKRAADLIKQEALETEKRKALEDKNRLAKEAEDKKAKEAEKVRLAEKEIERKAKEEKEAEKRKAEETLRQQEKKEQKFNEAINKANKKFEDGNYKGARDLYNTTLKIKDDQYAKDQLEYCNQNIKEAQETQRREDEEKYTANLIVDADNAFDTGKYKEAKKKYNLLVNKNKDDNESQNRLKEIAAILGQKKIENRKKQIRILIPLVSLIIISAIAYWFFTQPVYPKADFIVDRQKIQVGETVQYTSVSKNASQYKWRFIGGEPSDAKTKKPEVSYAKPGVYDIELIVMNDDGEDRTYAKAFITVVEKTIAKVVPLPDAGFHADKTSLVRGKTVQFTNDSKNADRVEWTFEKGTPSTSVENNPKIKYKTTGTFKVSMIAYNETGKKLENKNKYITVFKEIKKPVARFETDTTIIYVGGEISFRDLSSFADNREWEFMGGDPYYSKDQNPVVTYNEIGNYSVALSVKNIKGRDQIAKESFVIVLADPKIVKAEKFNKTVSIADGLYDKSLLNKALQKYKEAAAVVPGNAHVNGQIDKIGSLLSNKTKYDDLISKADKMFENDDFKAARTNYNFALAAKPGEKYPQQMMNKIDNILSVDNIAFTVVKGSSKSAKQILVTTTGYTGMVKVTVGEVYKDNKVKLNITTVWTDKKGRTVSEADEKITILKSHVTVSSPKVKIENFESADYLAFSNRATLKVKTDKSFEGGSITVSIDLRVFVKQSSGGIPVTYKYSNKNPSGNIIIKFDLEKYYKSK